ncbi:MAG TPA: L-threonylcarbamoyladenylate synthase [Tepidisphaeraceae bacterium]|jgi:L-threonylcarbamoyladenylate synthase
MSGSFSRTNPDIERAVEILRAGGLVAFPTETVYGLGADATQSESVRRIFAAKGRPVTNPLIVHVADAEVARRYVSKWPEQAAELARRFWPGPLTLVLPKADLIVSEVTAGLNSVGLRVPNHPLALSLLRAFDGPVAAPSANRANRISPTTADHVRLELGDAVDLVLDGGGCEVGIESTVLDLAGRSPVILRPGAVTREQIQKVIGAVGMKSGGIIENNAARSPGMGTVHYSPVAPTWRFGSNDAERVVARVSEHQGAFVSIIAMENSKAATQISRQCESPDLRFIAMPNEPDAYGQRLYASLREADAPGTQAIFVEMPPDQPDWLAVRDRLRRATRAL